MTIILEGFLYGILLIVGFTGLTSCIYGICTVLGDLIDKFSENH